MRSDDLASESGLRPLSAIISVAFVVLAVMVRVTYLSLADGSDAQGLAVLKEVGMTPAYGITDCNGTPLAVFLERIDLEMSPRSMWQAHTPDYMAERLAAVLGPEFEERELLAKMLPDARDGVITVDCWSIDEATAMRVDEWIRGEGEWERKVPGPLPGIGWQTAAGQNPRLIWKPVELLSRETRKTYGRTSNPLRWTRAIADALSETLFGSYPESISDSNLTARRAEIWKGLMPSQHCRAAKSIPANRALPLSKMLRREGVELVQMSAVSTREREYPSGTFPVLGHWGFTEEGQTDAAPYSGLELLCDKILHEEKWSFIDALPDTYAYRRERPARLQLRPYFVGRIESTGAPQVHMTIDVALQRMLRERLVRVMQESDPAVAMAIAVDLATGDVLAVDGIHAYGMAAFAPVKHQFMPGSTFKLVTMATALDAGVVDPMDTFEVGNGEWVLRIKGKTRVIHEAEGSRHGVIRAEECLAYSVNAGMVQIGLRVQPEVFHGRLVELGYGRYTEAGLGGEERGLMPSLPWSRRFDHASVSFGYQISTTLWQHMQALTTILRGGEFKRLRIAAGISHEDRLYELDREQPRRVFAPETCSTVRGMMEFGAKLGTGKNLYRDDISMGTKTGTAERVKTEVCLHVIGRTERALREAGKLVPNDLYRGLRGDRSVHDHCHTSSIVAVGRLPGEDREIAVLVVVDEPLKGGHFGSKVAGPPAMDILIEALGLTRDGKPITDELVPGFAPSTEDPGPRMLDESRDQPWNARSAF